MNQQTNQTERINDVTRRVLIAALVIIVIGTLAIPATLAILYHWAWLLAYPACLIALLIYAGKTGRKA